MKKQIDDYIKTCDRCSTRSRLYTPCVPGVVIDPPKEPFEIINMNIYTYNGNKLLLVIDELSRYIWVKENVNMQFVYKKVREFLLQFDSPKKLITDNGRELKNEKMQEICAELPVFRYLYSIQSQTQIVNVP